MRNDQEKIVNGVKSLIGELEANINALNAQQDNMVAEISAYVQPKKEAADKLVADAHAMLAQVEKEAAEAREKIGNEEKRQADEYTGITAERVQLEKDKVSLAEAIAAHEKTETAFDSYQSGKMSEIKTLNESLTVTHNDLAAREKALEEGLSTLITRDKALEEKEAAAKEAEDTLASRKAALDHRASKLAEGEADLSLSQTELFNGQQQLASDKTALATKDAELTVLLADAKARKDEYDEKIAGLKVRAASLDAYALRNEEDAATNQDALNLISAKNREIEQKLKRLEELRKLLPDVKE
jgi:putative ABC transport system permease protein